MVKAGLLIIKQYQEFCVSGVLTTYSLITPSGTDVQQYSVIKFSLPFTAKTEWIVICEYVFAIKISPRRGFIDCLDYLVTKISPPWGYKILYVLAFLGNLFFCLAPQNKHWLY
jgi:hypothetical protein